MDEIKVRMKQENLSLMALALDVSDYWLMGLDVPIEREDTGADASAQKQRFEAYAKGLCEIAGVGEGVEVVWGVVGGESGEGEELYGEVVVGAEDGGRVNCVYKLGL